MSVVCRLDAHVLRHVTTAANEIPKVPQAPAAMFTASIDLNAIDWRIMLAHLRLERRAKIKIKLVNHVHADSLCLERLLYSDRRVAVLRRREVDRYNREQNGLWKS